MQSSISRALHGCPVKVNARELAIGCCKAAFAVVENVSAHKVVEVKVMDLKAGLRMAY